MLLLNNKSCNALTVAIVKQLLIINKQNAVNYNNGNKNSFIKTLSRPATYAVSRF